jgi:ribosomal protein L16/L10AE
LVGRREARQSHVRDSRRSEEAAHEALRLASYKLPVKTKIVKRETETGGDQ